MDLWQTLRIFLRRWYVTLPLVLLSLALAGYVKAGVEPGYTVRAVALVQAPDVVIDSRGETPTLVPVNPLLASGAGTSLVAQTLSILAQNPDFRQRVTAGEQVAAYQVTVRPRESLMTITVESKDVQLATSTVDRVLSGLRVELEAQQEGLSRDQLLSFATLSPPQIVAADRAPIRASVAALAVALLISFSLVVALEALITRSSRRGGARISCAGRNDGSSHESADRRPLASARSDPASSALERRAGSARALDR